MSRVIRANIKGNVIDIPFDDEEMKIAINEFVYNPESILDGISLGEPSRLNFFKVYTEKLKSLELVKEKKGRYYLAPQLYLASIIFNQNEYTTTPEVYSFFRTYLGEGTWLGGYNFKDFYESTYYTEMFKEYFSPEFNSEMKKIEEEHPRFLEANTAKEMEESDKRFSSLFTNELESWRVKILGN